MAFGTCTKCKKSWQFNQYHAVYYDVSTGCFALCESCWQTSPVDEVISHYIALLNRPDRPAPTAKQLQTITTNIKETHGALPAGTKALFVKQPFLVIHTETGQAFGQAEEIREKGVITHVEGRTSVNAPTGERYLSYSFLPLPEDDPYKWGSYTDVTDAKNPIKHPIKVTGRVIEVLHHNKFAPTSTRVLDL